MGPALAARLWQLSIALLTSKAVLQNPLESPALRALVANVSRDSSALARFWSERRASGGPLIESVPGDTAARLVTFLWRERDSVRAVAVITPFSLIDIEQSRMRHLSGTDVWFRSFRMRNDAVMLYRFGPDDSMVPFRAERDMARRMSAWRQDPLNPSGFRFADGTVASILRLATHAEATPPSRAGTISADTVPGDGVSPDQPVFVYVPPEHTTHRVSHPLLVLMDGDAYLGLMGLGSILDRLGDDLPERRPLAVLIPADPARRSSQYNCDTGWSDFLARTLVPFIERSYATTAGPADRIVGGYSLGGLAAACAAIRHPETFGNVLAQSGSFYRSPDPDRPEAVARVLAGSPRLPLRWSLSIGLLERAPIPNADPSMLTATRHLRDVLAAKDYLYDYHEIFSGHEHVAWRALLPDALAWLLQPPR